LFGNNKNLKLSIVAQSKEHHFSYFNHEYLSE
jgi:hypothetical protein